MDWIKVYALAKRNGGGGSGGGSGLSLPSTDTPFQYLATDRDGNYVWNQMTHYTDYNVIASGSAALDSTSTKLDPIVIESGIGYQENRRTRFHDNSVILVHINDNVYEYDCCQLGQAVGYVVGQFEGIDVMLNMPVNRGANGGFKLEVEFASAPNSTVNISAVYAISEVVKLDAKYLPERDPGDALVALAETGFIDPALAADGSIFTDNSGAVYVF